MCEWELAGPALEWWALAAKIGNHCLSASLSKVAICAFLVVKIIFGDQSM